MMTLISFITLTVYQYCSTIYIILVLKFTYLLLFPSIVLTMLTLYAATESSPLR